MLIITDQEDEDNDYDDGTPGPQDSGDGASGQPTGPPSWTVGQAPLYNITRTELQIACMICSLS